MYLNTVLVSYITVCLGKLGLNLNIPLRALFTIGSFPNVTPCLNGKIADKADLAAATVENFA